MPRGVELLTGWNELAPAACEKAVRVTGAGRYRSLAQEIRSFLARTLWDGQTLRRAVDRSRPFEDHAPVASASS